MNILLVCAAGMSTSLLVTDMKKYADPSSKINAVGFSKSKLENVINEYDVVLVGPQLRFKLKDIEDIFQPFNKPVEVIESVAYGRMDGKKVLEFAKKLYS